MINKLTPLKNSFGLTLLEIMIAMTIMATLSVYTATSISSAISNREKNEAKIANMTMVNDSLRILKRDIEKAFHYQDIHTEIHNLAREALIQAKKEKQKKKQPGQSTNPTQTQQQQDNPEQDSELVTDPQTSPPGTPEAQQAPIQVQVEPREEYKFSDFEGSTNSLHFTSLGNIRTRAGEPVSDQAEVGYYIKNCRNRINNNLTSKCLWRRTTPYIDDNVKEGGNATVLLENIETFELRFYSAEKEEWVSSWSYKTSQDTKIKNHFPAAVEIHLVTKPTKEDEKRKIQKVDQTIVAPIAFPNNVTKEENGLAATTGETNAPSQ